MKGISALVVCLAIFSTSAYAHFDGGLHQPCDNQPPVTARLPVTVPVLVFTIPGADMFSQCRKERADLVIYGCTFVPPARHAALIFLNGDQDGRDRACTLLYEDAHLPPNNWFDESMEATSPDAKP